MWCHPTSTGVRARAQVGGIDAARDLKKLFDECRSRHLVGHTRHWNEGPGDLGKTAFDVIHQVSSPAQTLDAEFLARAVDCVIDPGAIFDGAVQLVCEIAAHPDARDLDLRAVDPALPETQKADVPQAIAGCLLERVQRGWSRDLKQVVVARPRFNSIAGSGEPLDRP